MSTPATVSRPSAAPSSVDRILKTFYAPREAFADLNRQATWFSWFAPWLLVALSTVALVVVIDKKIGFDQVAQNIVRMTPSAQQQIEQLPPERRAGQMQMMAAAQRYTWYAVPLIMLIMMAIVAGVLLLTVNFGLGAELTFKAMYAIVFLASLPGVLKALLGIVSIYAGVDPESYIPQNPVASNPGYFLDPAEVSRFIYGVATNLDLFMFWTLALTGVAIAANSKIKMGTAMFVTFGWWLVFTLVTSSLGAIFG